MDPQKASQLDPKIKEIYERVMNTPTKPLGSTAAANQPAVQKPRQNPSPINAQPQPQTPAGGKTQEQYGEPPKPPQAWPKQDQGKPDLRPQPKSSLFVAKNTADENPAGQDEEKEENKKGGIPAVILIMGIAVFLIVYALVWIKFFNVSLPFLGNLI